MLVTCSAQALYQIFYIFQSGEIIHNHLKFSIDQKRKKNGGVSEKQKPVLGPQNWSPLSYYGYHYVFYSFCMNKVHRYEEYTTCIVTSSGQFMH